MIELGSKIKLGGFDDMEPGQLVVVKKIVGSFAKKLAESSGFDSFEVNKNESSVEVRISSNGKIQESNASESNLFFSLSKALAGATGTA